MVNAITDADALDNSGTGQFAIQMESLSSRLNFRKTCLSLLVTLS